MMYLGMHGVKNFFVNKCTAVHSSISVCLCVSCKYLYMYTVGNSCDSDHVMHKFLYIYIYI